MAKQLAAKIELFEMGKGIYILRLNDIALQGAATKIAAALPAGSLSIAIVTPTDTKVFSLAGTEPTSESETSTVDEAAPARAQQSRPALTTAGIEEDPMDAAMRLADSANAAEAGADKKTDDDRKPNTVRKRPDSQKSDNTPNANCGRCGGSGQVAIVGVNSEATTATCPVCKGTGAIKKFGSTPTRRGGK